jgi:hypothetical protein
MLNPRYLSDQSPELQNEPETFHSCLKPVKIIKQTEYTASLWVFFFSLAYFLPSHQVREGKRKKYKDLYQFA